MRLRRPPQLYQSSFADSLSFAVSLGKMPRRGLAPRAHSLMPIAPPLVVPAPAITLPSPPWEPPSHRITTPCSHNIPKLTLTQREQVQVALAPRPRLISHPLLLLPCFPTRPSPLRLSPRPSQPSSWYTVAACPGWSVMTICCSCECVSGLRFHKEDAEGSLTRLPPLRSHALRLLSLSSALPPSGHPDHRLLFSGGSPSTLHIVSSPLHSRLQALV